MKKINYGISNDLQADVRYEPNACKGFVIDISLGCPHRCIYCLFSPLEMMIYKLKNPGFSGDTIPLKIDNFLKKKEVPPAVYMSYSSDPLGNKQISNLTVNVLKKLFEHNASVFFVTKGIFRDNVLETIKIRPDLMEIQIGVTNYDSKRNKIIEPGAPSYEKRLENIKHLAGINGLGSLSVRIDPMLPLIDDTPENIQKLIEETSRLGIKEAVIGYILLTRGMKNRMQKIPYLTESMATLEQKTETISGNELFSLPIDEKFEKLYIFEKMCTENGVKMSVCGCKDHQLKNSNLSWICNPYNREKREKLCNGSFVLDKDMTSHLK